jgi:uncharacterized protein
MENPIPKWLVGILGMLLIVFVGMLVVEKADALNDKFRNKKPANTLTVSGEGRVEAKPDMATVSIGVFSQGSNAETVKDENNRKVNAVIAYVKKQGVQDSDIKTDAYYFNPSYDWREGRSIITGYQGSQNVTVKFYGVDKSQDQMEKILDGVVSAGANQVYGVNFSIKDPDAYKQEARKKAIEKARQKAQELANEAGLKLGKVVSLSESGGSYPPIAMPYASDAMMGQAENQAKSVAPDIEPGTNEIVQVMTVVFEVK